MATAPLLLELNDALTREMAMLDAVKAGGAPGSALWETPERCLVAPRAMAAKLRGGLEASAARGWPCYFRPTGGDVTPQGPGVLSMAVAFRQGKAVSDPIGAAYGRVCAPLIAALETCGVAATTGPVAGSYCDGDFNVVVDGLKFAGTAQRMSSVAGAPGEWAALGHAMMITEGDEAEIIEAINALYVDAGAEKRVLTGVNVTLGDLGVPREAFLSALSAELTL